MSVLLIAEVTEGALARDATAKAVSAVLDLGAVTVLVAGAGVDAAAADAAKIAGVTKVLVADDPSLAHGLAEPMAALIRDVAGDYTHFVAPGTAQRGVGSALFPHTRAEAARRGYREIDATIRADNAGGLAYYARQGFVDVAVHAGVPLKDGTPVDRISRRLALRGG